MLQAYMAALLLHPTCRPDILMDDDGDGRSHLLPTKIVMLNSKAQKSVAAACKHPARSLAVQRVCGLTLHSQVMQFRQ